MPPTERSGPAVGNSMRELLKQLPKVDQLLEEPAVSGLIGQVPRTLVVRAVRDVLDAHRKTILEGGRGPAPDLSRPSLIAEITMLASELAQPHFRRVVNATGVVIHTNLGRSLMADEALAAIETAARHYSNLEYDLAKGKRGSRYSHVEGLLCDLTGAESALVVNNNAAAVLIALGTLAYGQEVIVSRGELVEIGGSFRIPEVMARSGSILVEVGTTNKTHLRDYENACTEQTALLLKVHQSNFRIVGFTAEVELDDLVPLGRKLGVPVMEDLGSGCFVDFSLYGLRHEPTVQQSIASGADVVTFSGDKLLGGPQAGLILGRREIIERIKRNPLNRAMRIDKFTLAALEATLRLYLDKETVRKVPTVGMITADPAELKKRAARLKRLLAKACGQAMAVRLQDGFSQVGGGALPTQDMPTTLVTLKPLAMSVNALEVRLRERPIPIIGRIEHDLVVFDVRTMHDEDFKLVTAAMAELCQEGEI
jgi:L-seryl-tRNA(Ser) seleniumtransferase